MLQDTVYKEIQRISNCDIYLSPSLQLSISSPSWMGVIRLNTGFYRVNVYPARVTLGVTKAPVIASGDRRVIALL